LISLLALRISSEIFSESFLEPGQPGVEIGLRGGKTFAIISISALKRRFLELRRRSRFLGKALVIPATEAGLNLVLHLEPAPCAGGRVRLASNRAFSMSPELVTSAEAKGPSIRTPAAPVTAQVGYGNFTRST
jgi:hypothetical protein